MPVSTPFRQLVVRQGLARFRSCGRGTTAVEFAFIAPMLMAFLFGIVGFGGAFATIHGLQQLASEAARASVAGLSDAERAQIASGFVTANVAAYALIDPAKLQVEARPRNGDNSTFEVVVTYDTGGSVLFDTLVTLGAPVAQLRRTATVKRGGY